MSIFTPILTPILTPSFTSETSVTEKMVFPAFAFVLVESYKDWWRDAGFDGELAHKAKHEETAAETSSQPK